MWNLRAVVVIGAVLGLAACSSSHPDAATDINKVIDLKSSFGPDFTVRDIARTGIDPKLLAGTALPAGLTFDPADCSKFAVGQQLPKGVQGNMAAVAAEGQGNRFITIALETSEPMTVNEPGRSCQKVAFAGGPMRGLIEAVEAPQIKGVQTIGVHRVVEASAGGKQRIGELYNYTAYFGPYQVMVTANPLVEPNKPVAPVDTARARDLLVAAVAAVRG